jgi:hypothetical protein
MYLINNIKRLLKTFYPREIKNFNNSQIILDARKLNFTLISELQNVLDSHTKTFSPEIFSNGSDQRWYHVKKQDPAIFDEILISSGVLETIKDELIDYEYIVLYNHIVASGKNSGSGDGYHLDSTFYQRKLIYYLTDANTENGCFQYIPGTGSLNFIRNYIIKNIFKKNILRVDNSKVKNKKKIDVIKDKGNGFLIRTSMFHRGNPLIKGERKAITFYLFKKNNFPKNLNKYL